MLADSWWFEILTKRGFRCLDDMDDEVRDRAALYLAILESPELCEKYIANGAALVCFEIKCRNSTHTTFVSALETTFSWASLERNLMSYLTSSSHSQPFNISTTPVVTKAQEKAERMSKDCIDICHLSRPLLNHSILKPGVKAAHEDALLGVPSVNAPSTTTASTAVNSASALSRGAAAPSAAAGGDMQSIYAGQMEESHMLAWLLE